MEAWNPVEPALEAVKGNFASVTSIMQKHSQYYTWSLTFRIVLS